MASEGLLKNHTSFIKIIVIIIVIMLTTVFREDSILIANWFVSYQFGFLTRHN